MEWKHNQAFEGSACRDRTSIFVAPGSAFMQPGRLKPCRRTENDSSRLHAPPFLDERCDVLRNAMRHLEEVPREPAISGQRRVACGAGGGGCQGERWRRRRDWLWRRRALVDPDSTCSHVDWSKSFQRALIATARTWPSQKGQANTLEHRKAVFVMKSYPVYRVIFSLRPCRRARETSTSLSLLGPTGSIAVSRHVHASERSAV